MNRRSFLKSIGITAGTAIAADSFGASAQHQESPLFLSTNNRDRNVVTSTGLNEWVPTSAQPWDVHTINHLYRRAGFGASQSELKAILDPQTGKTPGQTVDALLNNSLLTRPTVPPIPTRADQEPPQPPSWLRVPLSAVYTDTKVAEADYLHADMKIRAHWAVQMHQPEVMLREKMALFWMNHFVIESRKDYFPQMLYAHLTYMRQNAWGNFKQMVKDITVAPAMLFYLDGILNAGIAPNENYARELQELFTMGPLDKNGNPNYTQDDVEAIAHVLTGWRIHMEDPQMMVALYADRHDSSPQKIYDGQLRNYNLESAGVPMDMDLIDHIFELRADAIAWFMCSKFYQYFVYHQITTDAQRAIIQQLADTFKVNWNVKDVLSLLLKSEHFFDEVNIGSQIKSPYEYLIGVLRAFDIPLYNPGAPIDGELYAGTLYDLAFAGSQELLNPPNVKGWPGYHNWMSTVTLPYRNVRIATPLLIGGSLPATGQDGYGNSYKSIDLWDYMVTSWGKQLSNYDGTFDDLLREIANYLCAQPPSATALQYVKSQLPPNTYEWASLNDSEKLSGLRQIANQILLLADYQLC
ncbi:MAG: DUF1800 family protein [Bacteroidota bacterium]|nr:DUF1800 family protein [Bacteroidota bacterium]MDP4229745.1 DUF1800 family protein [Bacteroidota bacterium]MDP4235875.1 DUF1800 family protein [Bacteroidota bacterium]